MASALTRTSSVDLYWLPLGAGGHFVRWNGRLFESTVARREHRPALDLFHAALKVHLCGEPFVIEMGPVWQGSRPRRAVVKEGPVGCHVLGRSRLFRYEVRRWHGGVIPDVAEAVASPQRVSGDGRHASHLLDLVGEVPALTWGRDELHVGDMWNSNSLVAWLLARSGPDMSSIELPQHGRAPGWNAGLVLAERQRTPVAGARARPRTAAAMHGPTVPR